MAEKLTIHEITNAVIPNQGVRDLELVYAPGRSVADYLTEVGLEAAELQLFHSGNRVERMEPAAWIPRPGDHITVAPVVGDGGGGGKDVFRSIAMLAVMAAAIAIPGAIFGLTGWTAGLVGLGIAVAGGLVINWLVPPNQDTPQLDFKGDWGSSSTYGWEITNQTQPGFSIPVVYGTHRTGGQVIAEYVTTDGDNQYINMLLAVSEGEVSSVSDVWINNQPATNYSEVTTSTKTGTNTQNPISNFNDVYIDHPADAVVTHATPITRNMPADHTAEGLRVTLSFPYGLYITSSGDLNPKQVSVTLEYDAWDPTAAGGAGDWKGSWITWKTTTFSDNRAVAIRKVQEITGLTAGRYRVRVTRNTADDPGVTHKSTLYWSLLTEISPDDLAYPNVALVGVKALATNQLSGGTPTITSLVTRGNLTVKEEDGTPHTVSSDNPAWACWDILNNNRYGAGISYERLIYDTFLDWADWCDELVPDGKGGTEKRFTLNVVFDARHTVYEACNVCCQAGAATLMAVGSKYSVVPEKPGSAAHIYTIGSINEKTFTLDYLDELNRSNQIEVQWVNPDKDYTRDTLGPVIDPDADWDNSSTISLIGVTSQGQAVRLAKRRLYMTKYCGDAVSFECGAKALRDEIGDVIGVQHDVPQWGYGGRVVSATSNTVTLDQEVTLVEGSSYQIQVVLGDGSLVTKDISVPAGTTTTATLTVATPWATPPGQFHEYSFGLVSQVTEEFRLMGIERGGDLDFRLSALRYNASVFNCDTEIPELGASPTALAPPQVSGLVLGEDLIREGDRLRARLLVSWTPPSYYGGADVHLSIDGGIEQVYHINRPTDHFTIFVDDGKSCTVTVVAYSNMGKKSPRANAPSATRIVRGKLAPPEDVTGLAAQPSLTGLTLTWDGVSDIDLKEYVIRHTPETSGATWQNSTERARTTGTNKTFHAALEGTYLVKALDTSGVYSATAATVVVDLPATFVWITNSSLYDSTSAWDDGTMTDVFENASGNLQPAGSGAWDDITVLDDVPDVDMYGGPVSVGYYTFPEADLTADTAVRVTTDLRWAADDYSDRLDDWDDVDARDHWDAAVTANLGALMQVKYKLDGGAYSDWMDLWTRDFTARDFTLRAKLWTDDTAAWPTVSKAGYSIDKAA